MLIYTSQTACYARQRRAAIRKLGNRYACFQCGLKFYDLNRPDPLCPKCGADQRENPTPDPREAILARFKGKTTRVREMEEDEDLEDDEIEPDDEDLDEDDDEGEEIMEEED